jgi:chromate reductase, NAD(P)H dehydrogenase (quinone)
MIAVLSGTNRTNANSLKVARFYCQLLMRSDRTVHLVDLASLPVDFTTSALYENQGKNAVFNALKHPIEISDKLIIVVPEYNCSFPGVLKAFIDGLSYPNIMKGKKVALVGLSSGAMGGAIALSHLAEVLNYLGMEVFSYKVKLPFINRFIGENAISNDDYGRWIQNQLDAFEEY